jgi:hypothetical protein
MKQNKRDATNQEAAFDNPNRQVTPPSSATGISVKNATKPMQSTTQPSKNWKTIPTLPQSSKHLTMQRGHP